MSTREQSSRTKPATVSPNRQKNKRDGDIQFKVIIVGQSAVGKSCLLTRYVRDVFVPEHRVTLGAQFETKVVQLKDNYKAKLQIWDTAGQETFRSIVKTFYRNSAGVMLVYSLINKQSFDVLGEWFKEAKENAPANACFVLVGTHGDLPEQRAVDKKEIEEFKRQTGIMISFETSAKDNMNVSIAFEEIAAQSFDNYMRRRSSMVPVSGKKAVVLAPPPPAPEKKEGCC